MILFNNNPVIPAVRDPKKLSKALQCESNVIFLLTGDIFNLKLMADKIKSSGKHVFIHVDLVKGFSPDATFLKYLKEYINPTGIISTKNSVIKKAKEENIKTVQRLFLIDSASMSIASSSIKRLEPDAIEVLPGIMPKIIRKAKLEYHSPIISGGLIETVEEARECFKAGSISVSTSSQELWDAFSELKSERFNDIT
jgi:glycerol uptake operon antiterminator